MTVARKGPKSDQPLPSPNCKESTIRVEIYARDVTVRVDVIELLV